MDENSNQNELKSGAELEKEFGKKHPYMIYLVIVVVMFAFLLLMGYLAVENEWLPSRGIHSS